MKPWCRHHILFNRACTRCAVEEEAEDLPSIDTLEVSYANAHRAIAQRDGRPRDTAKPTAYELAMCIWAIRSKAWYRRHDGLHELGGEA